MAQSFHCPNCGAPLDPPGGSALTIRCPFCSSSVIIPNELRRQTRQPDTLSRAQAMADLPDSGKDMLEIIRLVKSGRKEEALQRFREAFDTSRSVAEDTIQAIERNQVVPLTHPHVRPTAASQLPAAPRYAASSKKRRSILFSLPILMGIGIGAFVLCIVGFAVFQSLIQPGGALFDWWQGANPTSKMPLILYFGEEGLQPGQLTDPENIAVDHAGNIFVADLETGRIQQFDPQGNFVHLWDAGDGKVRIWALEVDQDGVLYAAIDRTIRRYDTKTGAELEPLPNPNNYFYQDFKLLSGGGFGAVVNGKDLVRLNPDGSLVWMVEDAIGSISGESDTGGRLGIDGNNTFYLAGRFVESVFVYSPEGKYLNRWGSDEDDGGVIDFIRAIDIDSQGRIIVCDNGELEIFNSDSSFIEQIDFPDIAFDMQVGLEGKIYMVTHEPRVNVYQLKEE
jgi:hypothetical protein